MLTADGCRARRQRLWERLQPKPDWVLIADPQHLVYFANYYQSPFVFRSADAGAVLILGADGSSILVADNIVSPFAGRACVDDIDTPVWYEGKASAPHREAFLVKNVLERLARCPGRDLGVEPAQTPAGIIDGLRAAHGELRLTDVSPVIRLLKRQKDGDELALLRVSMKAGEAGMRAAMQELKPGMTEMDAFQIVQRAAQRVAQEVVGEPAVIYGDFVSGPRCQEVGGPPSHRKIEQGDLFLLDFSTVVFEYRADFANTWVVGGKPSERQRDVYRACLVALREGELRLKPGVPCRDIYWAVRHALAEADLARYFPGHAGHGIGLGHPEPPYLVPQSSDTLLSGDVVTLEPGAYIPGDLGMRFERNYLITQSGYELLSHHALAIEV